MLNVGSDVRRRRTQVPVTDEGGHELFNRNVPNDSARLSEVLCGAEPGTPVVFDLAQTGGGPAVNESPALSLPAMLGPMTGTVEDGPARHGPLGGSRT